MNSDDNKKNLNLKEFDPRIIEKRRINPKIGPPTIVIIGKRGTGKCLGKDTPIIMYDGSIKMIQDIKIGEQVMGDDSTPRNVLGTTMGKSEMYKIKQNNGNDYIVNDQHILSLKIVKKSINIKGKEYHVGDTIDISIKEYLKFSKIIRKKNFKGYKVSVEFSEKDVPFNPYLLGLWLGKDKCEKYNILNKCEKYNYIPYIYLCNSKENRFKLLAGILDVKLLFFKKNNISFFIKDYKFAKDIEYLSRSLGFLCNIEKNKKKHYMVYISGNKLNEIPCLIKKKQIDNIKNSNNNLFTDIKIKNIGINKYYGFELDKNHRFLLGDFTVSHNSYLVADLLYHFRKIPAGMIMSGTEAGCEFFSKIFPASFIYEDYDPEKVSQVIKEQKKITKIKDDGKMDKSSLLLLEDCMYDKKALKSKDIRGIFMNGRHWKILFMLTMQYCMDILPELRSNIDFVFVLREQFSNIRKKLYDNFFGILPTFDDFNEVMDRMTNDFGCLVLNNTSRSNKIEDCLFWYKAKFPVRKVKIGSKQLWDYHKKNYKKEDNDIEETIFVKKKGKSNIKVNKIKKKKNKLR